MAKKFTEDTFKYFDRAKRNRFKKEWFEKNKAMYEEHVKEPFSFLLQHLKEELGQELPKISIDPKKITRPIRPSNRAIENGPVKYMTHATLWEKKTSLFEWNPAIHIQFGAEKEDNLYAPGLYMVSSRQLSLLRNAAVKDYELLDEITGNKDFKKRWGQKFGEQYKRFPRGYDETHPSAKYIWYKQFYVSRTVSRTEVMKANFAKTVVKDFKIAMPFFKWIRETVGVYKR